MLFGLFFGAGNLIFPVYMGQLAGSNVWSAIAGFLITAVGLPLLGVASIGISRSDGLVELSGKVGRGYSIAGCVEEGKQVGRTIGFPTANITIPPHKALPAFGVYACYLETSGGIFPAVVNVGRHPTLPEGHVTVEAHVLDEFLSLYGRNVRLTFLKFMRPEQKFDSIEVLRAQIAHDADACRAYFAQLQ